MDHMLIRHYIAALSYRTTVAIKDAPTSFPDFDLGKETRKPIEILNHMSILITYVLRCYTEYDPGDITIGSWESEKCRFYDALEKLDQVLAKGISPTKKSTELLVQGPFADAMTHVGQLTMLRRLADAPIPYENYMNADIRIGQVHSK